MKAPPNYENLFHWLVRVTGLALFIREALTSGPERPYMLTAFLAMIGLAEFIKLDRKRNGKGAR